MAIYSISVWTGTSQLMELLRMLRDHLAEHGIETQIANWNALATTGHQPEKFVQITLDLNWRVELLAIPTPPVHMARRVIDLCHPNSMDELVSTIKTLRDDDT